MIKGLFETHLFVENLEVNYNGIKHRILMNANISTFTKTLKQYFHNGLVKYRVKSLDNANRKSKNQKEIDIYISKILTL